MTDRLSRRPLSLSSRVAAPSARGGGRRGEASARPRHQVKPLRILVVEDDRDSAKMLELLLSRQADEVAVADSVRTALTRAAEPWDVVISDLSLPDGSGNAVATAFRKGTPRPRRIIALSGSGSAVDVAASARAGFDSHLVKPLQVSALLEMLDRLRMH